MAEFSNLKDHSERREFYDRLERRNLAPLWEVLHKLVAAEPRSVCVPTLWKYPEIRLLLLEAGAAISAEEAERRVLVLENPGIHGASQVTPSLYAGVQLILPGETAASHRHSASALRFVLESGGAYTTVEGVRVAMSPGDLILTPSWTLHDHGNPGAAPAIWLDGLDVPIVNLFDAGFSQRNPASPWLAAGETPVLSPYRYPYARARSELAGLQAAGAPDRRYGFKLTYGEGAGDAPWPISTMSAFLQLLPAGFHGQSHRATDGAVFCCVAGRGSSQIGDRVFEWGERDIFVVPSWIPVSHRSSSDAVLFSFSDRRAQQALGLWREQAQ